MRLSAGSCRDSQLRKSKKSEKIISKLKEQKCWFPSRFSVDFLLASSLSCFFSCLVGRPQPVFGFRFGRVLVNKKRSANWLLRKSRVVFIRGSDEESKINKEDGWS